MTRRMGWDLGEKGWGGWVGFGEKGVGLGEVAREGLRETGSQTLVT